uniref:Ig-like domain-containing protein n=1 Tax=Oreochromis aureus TaxID=47969 RepID=A0A668S682_OREAU
FIWIVLYNKTHGLIETALCMVAQVPSSILGSLNGETAISCNHSESTYNVILWYQKPRGDSALKLIGYILYGNPTIEDGFQESFKISGDGSVKSQLEVEKLKAEDSGIYYCAASTHSELVNAYFGGGTKLTVLASGRDVTAPKEVKILGPSEHECRNSKDKKRKKTLVCVASGFYPDHVKVYWHMNEKNVTNGVATDEAAREEINEKNEVVYKITSRLRVYAKQWENPKNTFKCIVGFITANGTETPFPSKPIRGVQGNFFLELNLSPLIKICLSVHISVC